jgi:hypothetical protein
MKDIAPVPARVWEMPADIRSIFRRLKQLGGGNPVSLAFVCARQPVYLSLSPREFSRFHNWLAQHAPHVNLRHLGYYDMAGKGVLPEMGDARILPVPFFDKAEPR